MWLVLKGLQDFKFNLTSAGSEPEFFFKFDSGSYFECIIYLGKIVLFVNRNAAHERSVQVFKII
jgi:hypothetical protein